MNPTRLWQQPVPTQGYLHANKRRLARSDNGPDQRLATNGLATTHDDARESFASGGSGPSRGLATAPPPHDRMILPALRACGPFEPARGKGWNHRGPLHRGIGPPLEAQRLDASGGWTSHQVLRAADARPRPDEPKPFEPATLNLQLLRGHAGDGPTAYRTGPLLKPQATEPGWNGKAQQRGGTQRPEPSQKPIVPPRRLQRLVRRCPLCLPRRLRDRPEGDAAA